MTGSDAQSSKDSFDAQAKERELRNESEQWDTSEPEEARADDIPVIDLHDYFTSGSDEALNKVAQQLRVACEETGFISIIGHQITAEELDSTFEQVRKFHALPVETKKQILMDRPDWPVGGMGYLPLKNRKLPARQTGNVNEAFIVKCDDQLTMNDNQWPDEESVPGYRQCVEQYAQKLSLIHI